MNSKRLTDAILSTDPNTGVWKSRFRAAKAAYEEGKLKESESLLHRALEEAKQLPEHAFATNTTQVGLGVVYLAEGRTDEAYQILQQAVNSLRGQSEPALKELYGVALRFFANLIFEKGQFEQAESMLQESINVLEDIGTDGALQLCYTLSDLAIMYVKHGMMKDAADVIDEMGELAGLVFGPNSPEYIRMNLIYQLCHTKSETELVAAVEDSITKMRYLRGEQHPRVKEAIRLFLEKLHQSGDTAAIKEVEQLFGSVNGNSNGVLNSYQT
jgi:tetratricopeptide (TPR) repeat protein